MACDRDRWCRNRRRDRDATVGSRADLGRDRRRWHFCGDMALYHDSNEHGQECKDLEARVGHRRNDRMGTRTDPPLYLGTSQALTERETTAMRFGADSQVRTFPALVPRRVRLSTTREVWRWLP